MLGEKKPRRLHILLESRVALEALAHVASRPLHRFLPTGDGHPVLVIPAFMTADSLTAPLRRSLNRLGYAAHPWHKPFYATICASEVEGELATGRLMGTPDMPTARLATRAATLG